MAEVSPYPDRTEVGALSFLPIHTPGHSKDHTVYLEEQHGWLFSGDLYLGDRIKFFRSDERIGEQIASLEKVLTFDFDALFCGHRPRPEGGRAHLERKLDFLGSLHATVSEWVRQGLPERTIVRRLRPRGRLEDLVDDPGQRGLRQHGPLLRPVCTERRCRLDVPPEACLARTLEGADHSKRFINIASRSVLLLTHRGGVGRAEGAASALPMSARCSMPASLKVR